MKCPIYTVGDGKRTQIAMRDDGVWFIRTWERGQFWTAWKRCAKRPYEFTAYIDNRAGNARLPKDGERYSYFS